MTKDNSELLTELFPAGYAFNLSDFALFLSVMKNKTAYECTLSIILDEPDVKMEEVKVEQVILNHYGKRAIRLDAWGKTTDDIFGKDIAKYTFTEQCEEIEGLHLEDGTKKIFLNMTSKNGSKELISLLQYMKDTRLDNPEIETEDERLIKLNEIVSEVKESEEWEAVQMNILEVGIQKGLEQGEQKKIVSLVCKKIAKGYTVDEIADMLEEEPSVIQPIYDIAKKYQPDYDIEQIYRNLVADKKKYHIES